MLNCPPALDEYLPMFKDDALIGAIVFYARMSAFHRQAVALVRNFATQAVIAIKNTRLLDELRKSCSSRLRPLMCSR